MLFSNCQRVPSETDFASVSAAWGKPEKLKINTTGIEDGACISPDGKTLFYTYTSWVPLKYPAIVVQGPSLDSKGECQGPCGDYPRADVFYAVQNASGDFDPPRIHPLTIKKPIGGIINPKNDLAYFMYQFRDADKEDITFAKMTDGKWGEPREIAGLNSAHVDADPWVDSNETEMFFWSARPSGKAQHNIFYATNLSGVWSAPILLPSPINSDKNDMQPFLFGNTLYFSSDRDGILAIYTAERSNGQWGEPQKVVASKYGVGEPTLTKDGQWLYFVQVFGFASTFLVFQSVDYDFEIMRVRKK